LSQTPRNELDLLLEEITLKLKEKGLPESVLVKLEREIRNNDLDEHSRYTLEDKLGSLDLVNRALFLVK
jgi:hypothetical protein